MKCYLDLCKHILDNGTIKKDRTGTGTISLFGYQMRCDLSEGFPLLTTKKVFTKGIIHELLWFLNGDTNIKYLVDNNVHIWDDDAYRYYLELCNKYNIDALDKESFLKMVQIEAKQEFNGILYKFGDLGKPSFKLNLNCLPNNDLTQPALVSLYTPFSRIS